MVTIYTERKSSRFEFVVNQIFKHILGCQYIITSDERKFLSAECPAICYAEKYLGNGIHIVPNGLLFEKDIHPLSIEISYWKELPIFFQTQDEEIPFDLFSASFYLLTRYEEYVEKETDKHGRYPAEKSLAFRYNFLEQPIVDQWAVELRKMMEEKCPGFKCVSPHFLFIPSIDVDNVFAFRHKGPFVNGYHLLKEIITGNFQKAGYRLSVIWRQKEDPFFNLKKITALHQSCGTLPIFFFHCGGYGKYDKKTLVPSLGYRFARRNISRDFIVGLHPSYKSHLNTRQFRIERKALENSIMDRKIFHNRFHYLRFILPKSYQMLSLEGLRHDWSMGYSDYPGFRAGTSFPFHFFNLESNRTHRLMIHPFVIMDKTLKNNLNFSVEESFEYILNIAEKVKATNGVFVTIFHNQNLTDVFEWEGWKNMYQLLIQKLSVIQRNHKKEIQ